MLSWLFFCLLCKSRRLLNAIVLYFFLGISEEDIECVYFRISLAIFKVGRKIVEFEFPANFLLHDVFKAWFSSFWQISFDRSMDRARAFHPSRQRFNSSIHTLSWRFVLSISFLTWWKIAVHLRRRRFFPIFLPLPPHVEYIRRQQITKEGRPLPPRNCRRLKWTAPYVIYNVADES